MTGRVTDAVAMDEPLSEDGRGAGVPAEVTPGLEARGSAAPSVWPPMGHVLAVAAGGMIGAVLRVGLAQLSPNPAGGFPWTTFVENVIGAFLLGFLLVALLERWRAGRSWQPFLCTGVLGSFTTFSNLSIEWISLAQQGQVALAVIYPVVSMIVGMAAAVMGMAMARQGLQRLPGEEGL